MDPMYNNEKNTALLGFSASDVICTQCQLSIQMKDRDLWIKDQCAACLRCLHHCRCHSVKGREQTWSIKSTSKCSFRCKLYAVVGLSPNKMLIERSLTRTAQNEEGSARWRRSAYVIAITVLTVRLKPGFLPYLLAFEQRSDARRRYSFS